MVPGVEVVKVEVVKVEVVKVEVVKVEVANDKAAVVFGFDGGEIVV